MRATFSAARFDFRAWAGGALAAAFGAAAFFKSRSYAFGSPLRMGPGFFPSILSGLICLLGLTLMASAFTRQTSGGREFRWRPAAALPAAIACFALLLERVGLAPATVALVLIASLAEPKYRPVRACLLAVSVLALIYVVFILILRMPIAVLA